MLRVEGELRQAASENGLLPTAIEDALTRALRIFTVDDEGALLAQDHAGSTIFGKDGKASITPSEWLSDMRERAPHWYPAPVGAGATGGEPGVIGTHSLSRTQARDVKAYREARKKAIEVWRKTSYDRVIF